jgi:hypothetical protein
LHNVKESRDSIAKVREVAAHNRWEAGKWDRELFGEDKGDVNVNVLNIGALHVEALRHRMHRSHTAARRGIAARERGRRRHDRGRDHRRAPGIAGAGCRRAASKGVTWDGTTARCWDCDRSRSGSAPDLFLKNT